MPGHGTTVAIAKPEAQARLTTGGQLFLDRVDGRSAIARRYRDVLAQLTAAIGGKPTDAQAILLRRAATLTVLADQAESELARGDPIDVAAYNTSTNSLRRLLRELGLGRPPARPRGRIMEGYLHG